jgi:Tfp pilus assembly protein PilF
LLLSVYAPSLSGGFLNYDDPWLAENNPFFAKPDAASLLSIWTDFSVKTRYRLGAEFLPLRDTSHWLEANLVGLNPTALRLTNLILYWLGLIALRGALKLGLPLRWQAEACVALFALHPVHVESVAWIAGRKDVLALCFLLAALFIYAKQPRNAAWWAAALLALACLSKAIAVIGVGLFLAQDVLMQRKVNARSLMPSAVVSVAAAALHAHVGSLMQMTAAPPGGSRWAAFLTFGEILQSYAQNLLWPTNLSVVYDVNVATTITIGALFSYVVLASWLYFGWGLRNRRPVVLAAWLWLAVPLVPVSQVLFALQNLMADRYLLFSALAPALLLIAAVDWLIPRIKAAPARVFVPALGALSAVLAVLTFARTECFASSRVLFIDATAKTTRNGIAPYQLARALEAEGDLMAADEALRVAIARSEFDPKSAELASLTLARHKHREGDFEAAAETLEQALTRAPNSPEVVKALMVVRNAQGRRGEAAELSRKWQDLRRQRKAHVATGP